MSPLAPLVTPLGEGARERENKLQTRVGNLGVKHKAYHKQIFL